LTRSGVDLGGDGTILLIGGIIVVVVLGIVALASSAA